MAAMLVALLWAGDLPRNERIVAFARSKLGRRVGDGECTALAAEALRHAGFRPRRYGEGRWGEELESLRDARPGDILQFEDAVFVRRRGLPDGGCLISATTYPHHTAIIADVRRRGPKPVLVVLHQNVGGEADGEEGRKVVRQTTINMAEKRRGTVRLYRPTDE